MMPAGYFADVSGRVEQQERAVRSLSIAIAAAILAVFILLDLALGSFAETAVILATLPDAFVGGIIALLIPGETWNVSSPVGLIGLFGIAVQNGWCSSRGREALPPRAGHSGTRSARRAVAECVRK